MSYDCSTEHPGDQDVQESGYMNSTEQRRIRVLKELADTICEHTGRLAIDLDIPKSTLRRDLDCLEDQCYVDGILHDERDTLWQGRKRIYWSITDRGKSYLASIGEG